MFTNNYIAFRKAAFTAGYSYSTTVWMKNAVGSSVEACVAHFAFADIGYWMTKALCATNAGIASSTTLTSQNFSGLYFGTGSTPATKADYKLESPITSGLTITNPSALVWDNDGNGKYTACADFIVRNTTESEINIYEIGVFVPTTPKGTAAVSSTQGTVNYVLMERTVLDEPITITPGESKLVTYKITFNQTLNVE